jgi:hypothetical protein
MNPTFCAALFRRDKAGRNRNRWDLAYWTRTTGAVFCLSLALGGQHARAAVLLAKVDSGFSGLVSMGPGSVKMPLPLAADVSGSAVVFGSAGTEDYAPPTTKGNIITLGPPITYARISTGLVSASDFFGAVTASSRAAIFGQASADGKSALVFPFVGVSASGIPSEAAGGSGTDPFIMTPLAAATPMTVEINLNPSTSDDPDAGFSFQAVSDSNALGQIASDSFNLSVTTNIPGFETILSMTITDSSVSGMNVSNWTSPVLAQPFTGSDFTADDNGVYTLDPSKALFDLTFMVPAGDFALDSNNNPTGLQLNIDESAVATTPEPATVVLAGWLGVVLAAVGLRRRQ